MSPPRRKQLKTHLSKSLRPWILSGSLCLSHGRTTPRRAIHLRAPPADQLMMAFPDLQLQSVMRKRVSFKNDTEVSLYTNNGGLGTSPSEQKKVNLAGIFKVSFPCSIKANQSLHFQFANVSSFHSLLTTSISTLAGSLRSRWVSSHVPWLPSRAREPFSDSLIKSQCWPWFFQCPLLFVFLEKRVQAACFYWLNISYPREAKQMEFGLYTSLHC